MFPECSQEAFEKVKECVAEYNKFPECSLNVP
jgi:hypothetical protein